MSKGANRSEFECKVAFAGPSLGSSQGRTVLGFQLVSRSWCVSGPGGVGTWEDERRAGPTLTGPGLRGVELGVRKRARLAGILVSLLV